MTGNQPDILVPREGETRLLWAILVSGVVHAVSIVAVVIVPGYWNQRPAPAVSYTVDLVASAEPAGTNLPAGPLRGKPKPPAPAAAAPPPAEPPRAPEAKAPENPVAPPPPPQEAQALAAPPKPVAPKPEPVPAQKADVKLASKTIKPTLVKAQAPAPTPAVAKAKATAPAAKPTAVVAQKQTPAATRTAEAKASEMETRDKQIAAAIPRRVQDQKIADAVQRRMAAATRQNGPGVGAEGTAPGGPVSIGQGTGTGGVVEGLDMILYRGQMERRIKENWVWAGEELGLEVKVQFDVTPTGEIQNVRVTGPSGNKSYDASAERAVRAASPLPPPPEKYRALFVNGVEITFRPQDLQS